MNTKVLLRLFLSEYLQVYHQRLILASETPDPTTPIRRLLILFGSDGGHAEGLARRLSREASSRGVHQCLCLPLDALADVTAALQELRKDGGKEDDGKVREYEDDAERPSIDGAVAVVVSTAGQGEFPGNAKKFWKRLTTGSQTQTLFEGVRYAVFGLGDSKYWPKDPEYFGKPSKLVDDKLSDLGAERILEMGLGDDQDVDKYETAWRVWAPRFWDLMKWDKTTTQTQEETEEAGL